MIVDSENRMEREERVKELTVREVSRDTPMKFDRGTIPSSLFCLALYEERRVVQLKPVQRQEMLDGKR